MTPTEKAETRRDAFNDIIADYDQLLEIYATGGAAPLTGHAYNPKKFGREATLIQNLKELLVGMRDVEAAKVDENE
jgi:hypothetical protein